MVIPGRTFFPTSSSARAAIFPATRILSMISGVLTSGSPVRGRFFPTYSGRGMLDGTLRIGETCPGRSSWVVIVMQCSKRDRGNESRASVIERSADGR